MNDELSQLLRHTDQQTPPPSLNSAALPSRVRQSAERQFRRRIATGLLATIPILVYILFIAVQHLHQPQAPLVQADLPSDEELAMQIAYHQRVADLLESHHSLTTPSSHATDDFLFQLQLERSKAAMVLLNGANDRLRTCQQDKQAIDALRQMTALFPETPAASTAQQILTQLENSQRQS